MTGGTSNPKPGEISLAHNGVLFLDELPEFRRSVLEVLRQPMEENMVTISRAKITVEYPAGFMLIASMNPCPCGFYNHPEKECVCGAGAVKKYLNKISNKAIKVINETQKKEIIHRVTDNGEKVSELSKEYGVVAKTIYKLLGRKANQSSAVLELSKLRRENEALLSIIGSLVAESKLGKKKR